MRLSFLLFLFCFVSPCACIMCACLLSQDTMRRRNWSWRPHAILYWRGWHTCQLHIEKLYCLVCQFNDVPFIIQLDCWSKIPLVYHPAEVLIKTMSRNNTEQEEGSCAREKNEENDLYETPKTTANRDQRRILRAGVAGGAGKRKRRNRAIFLRALLLIRKTYAKTALSCLIG